MGKTDSVVGINKLAKMKADELLEPSQVAALFRVDPKTVTRWARQGKLTPIRTLGGHRRYLAGDVRAALKKALESTHS